MWRRLTVWAIAVLAVAVLAVALINYAGEELLPETWVARYDGPTSGYDEAHALVIDDSGNVYVTGRSGGSGTSNDYATVKYDSAGNQLWVARYNRPEGGQAWANAIAVDGSGNVYVTGDSEGGGTSYDYATVKYDSDGNELWAACYDGPPSGSDGAGAIALDELGNVYVTGYSAGNGSDYATIKYDNDGNELWVARYNGPASSKDEAYAIGVDGSGNVYVTGHSLGNGTSFDYATIKYAKDGAQLWVARYNGPASREDEAHALDIDDSGNIYVTGHSMGSGTSSDYATIKYDTDGNELWVARYNRPEGGQARANAIAVDDSGNAYVTGSSRFTVKDYVTSDSATAKYNPQGNRLWVSRYDGPEKQIDGANAVAVDESGNVYVTGSSGGIGTSNDYLTIKYGSDGKQLWIARYNGPSNLSDSASTIAVDGGGNVYVTGHSYGDDTSADYVTIKYAR